MNKNKLLIFSKNKYKIWEIKKILPNKNLKVLTLNDFKKIRSPKENGSTFQKNAMIKSKFGYKNFNMPCIADDSGICIEALNNGPGINSNRYQKKLGGYKKTFKKILQNVKEKKSSKAFFVSVISYTYAKNKTKTFTGIKKGRISKKPLGMRGFHYDPIFIPRNHLLTYGQMSKKKKNEISHRSIAIKKLILFLKKTN